AMGTAQYTVEKAKTQKKVVVVGGGPGGMEAARVAALRGHDVTLYEKTSQLGGLLALAALIKGIQLEDLPGMVRYLKTQVRKNGVKVKLGTEFTAAMVDEIKPDAIILATGGTLTMPDMAGVSSKKVVTTPALHKQVKPFLRLLGPRLLGRLTKLWLPGMGRNVVVIGSGLHGFEVAEFLLKRGRKVTIVDTAETIGEGMLDFRLGLVMDWLGRIGAEVLPALKSIRITDEGVDIITPDGQQRTIKADTVVPTSPLVPNTALQESLEGKVPEIYAIGDCAEPNLIVHAIRAGWHTANSI
ncbi:FAD-dependent oxidoreductase, partial [Chloroflexota bacterium]